MADPKPVPLGQVVIVPRASARFFCSPAKPWSEVVSLAQKGHLGMREEKIESFMSWREANKDEVDVYHDINGKAYLYYQSY